MITQTCLTGGRPAGLAVVVLGVVGVVALGVVVVAGVVVAAGVVDAGVVAVVSGAGVSVVAVTDGGVGGVVAAAGAKAGETTAMTGAAELASVCGALGPAAAPSAIPVTSIARASSAAMRGDGIFGSPWATRKAGSGSAAPDAIGSTRGGAWRAPHCRQ